MSQCQKELDEAEASARRWRIVAVVFIVLGVSLGGVVALLIWKRSKRECSDIEGCMLEAGCKLTEARVRKAQEGLAYAKNVGAELGGLAGMFQKDVDPLETVVASGMRDARRGSNGEQSSSTRVSKPASRGRQTRSRHSPSSRSDDLTKGLFGNSRYA